MSNVPGVLAQSRYGTADLRLTIRGFGSRGAGDRSNSGTSRGVRVLINGIPETEPDGRTAFDNVDLYSAQSIDVVRSNSSAQWGNAAGGVVNVNTIPEFSGSYMEEFGAIGGFGLKRIGMSGGREIGSGKAFGTLVNTSFDGWRRNSMANRTTFDGGVVTAMGPRTNFRALLNLALNRLNVPGPLTQAQMDADPSQANATYLARRERRDNKLGRIALGLDHKVTDASGFSTMLFVQPKYLQRSERNTYRDFNRYHMGGNAVYRRTDPMGSNSGTLTVGTDVAYQDGTILFYSLNAQQERGTTLTDNKREGANNFGVFVSEDLAIGARWVLSLGARWDAITYTYSSNITPALNTTKNFTGVTPKVGVTYKVSPTHSWFVSLGGGVEVPAGNETDPEPGTPNAVFAINPLLDPIRSTTVEVGTRRALIRTGEGFISALSYDAAGFYTTVSNEIVPYNGGRFYFSAGGAERMGLELGASVAARGGWTLRSAVTLMQATYRDYVVDSVHYGKPGAKADYSGNEIVGLPQTIANATVGWAPAALKGLKVQWGVQHTGSYVVDDANKIEVPSATVMSAGVASTRSWKLGSRLNVQGSVMVTNLADTKHVGSAFLNPDRVTIAGISAPAAFEPGLPRQVVISLSFGRMR